MQFKLSNSLRLERLYLIPLLEDVNDKSRIFSAKRGTVILGRSRPLLPRISSAHAIHDVAHATSCISSARAKSKLGKIES